MLRRVSACFLGVVALVATGRAMAEGRTGEQPASLVVGVVTRPSSGDPRFVGLDLAGRRLEELRFLPLTFRGADGAVKLGVAASIESRDDRLWRVVLKKGFRFADGREILAEDVVATYSRVVFGEGRQASPRKPLFANIEKISLISNYELNFLLKKSDRAFPSRLEVGILPAASLALSAEDLPGLGYESGPFVAVRLSESLWVLHRNDRFNAQALGLSRPEIQRLSIRFHSDAEALSKALVKGDVELVPGEFSATQLTDLRKFHNGKLAFSRSAGPDVLRLGFPLSEKRYSQEPVRRALAMMINAESLIKYAAFGAAEVVDSESLSGGDLLWEKIKLEGESSLDRARRLLDEAGVKDPDGNGPIPRFKTALLTSKNPESVLAAKAVATMWRPLGVEAHVEIVDDPSKSAESPSLDVVNTSRSSVESDSQLAVARIPILRYWDTWVFRNKIEGVKPFADGGFLSLLSVSK
jgi:peptide/nickel transport system substrate-binding protein